MPNAIQAHVVGAVGDALKASIPNMTVTDAPLDLDRPSVCILVEDFPAGEPGSGEYSVPVDLACRTPGVNRADKVRQLLDFVNAIRRCFTTDPTLNGRVLDVTEVESNATTDEAMLADAGSVQASFLVRTLPPAEDTKKETP